ncbi:hypothetical protein UMC2_33901 [[Clostridium] sordellii]|uniref:hypothetical protein n=1 Tax=Paraclostridium sordellii TaxID=1505 RepID=UPI00054452B6|nr:hypothetical protein [Paeniclostridium sordellii]CEK36520.1 hypothetical protein UMC2_33901 [[Clostridium] sordellii] [Paeniclostridium sordellii]
MDYFITSEWSKGLLYLGVYLAILSIIMTCIKSTINGKYEIIFKDKEVQTTMLNVFLIELLAIVAYSLHQYDLSMIILSAMLYSSIKSLHDCLYTTSAKILLNIKLKDYKEKEGN